jgi:poly-gamma-glutamate synthesis protein (capsule biosynthesis protein)
MHPQPDSLAYLSPYMEAADLRLANLESPLSPGSATRVPAQAGYDLCADSARAALLQGWGLDLLSLANNHRFDCGPAGPGATVQALTALGLTPVGPGPQPVYRQIHGLKLAFLSFDDILAPIDATAAVRAVQSAGLTGALVIVSVHWGLEYQSGATARQKSLAGQFAAAGAALIVGSHPHVLQPAGWIPTARGKSLVLYSLGNALFDQPGLPDTRQSALALVTLTASGVQSIRVVPFEIDVANSQLVRPSAQAAAQIRVSLGLP